jgi:hypothetical protein
MDYRNGNQCHKNWILAGALVLGMLFGGGMEASATSTWMSSFNSTYPSSALRGNCSVCHTSPPSRNSYGDAYRSAGHNFSSIESQDSDGDGFTNIEEINAGTFPGNSSSTPPTATPPSITTSSLPSGTVGSSYSQSLSASGGTAPYSWSVTSGNLPSGLNLSSGGTISGTPTSSGTSNFTVQVSGGGTATRSLSITIAAETPPPTADLPSVTPPDGTVDVPVTAAVIVSADVAGALEGATITLTESTLTFAATSDPGGIMCVNGGVVSGTTAFDDLFMNATFTPDCPLANGMTYTVTVTPKGDMKPMTSTFTTIVQTADTDQDGVEDGEDELPDDDTEATPPRSKGEGKFHVSVRKDGHRHLRKVRGISDTHFSINQEGRPRGYEFRDGLVDYEVHGISPGESVEVTIESPEEIPSGSKVYMSDGNGFHEIPAVISENRFTVTVTDGGVGDVDGHADGVIDDPVGVAVPTATGDGSTGVSTDAAGGGCSVVGTGGGWKEAAGSYGLLTLVLLGLALRRRKPENGR